MPTPLLQWAQGAHPSWDSSKQHLSGSLAASRAEAETRGASGFRPHSPGCPCLATVPHHLASARAGDKGWFPALAAHMALLVPLRVVPWTQELQQDESACPGWRLPAAPALTWGRSSMGMAQAQAAALCSFCPAAWGGRHGDGNGVQLGVPGG